jgi:hypothetical protein
LIRVTSSTMETKPPVPRAILVSIQLGGLTVAWNVEDGISIPKLKIEDRRRARVHRVHDNGVAQAAVAVPVVANERFKRRQWPGETDAVRNDDTSAHRFCRTGPRFPGRGHGERKATLGGGSSAAKKYASAPSSSNPVHFIEFPRNVAFLLSPRSQLAISTGVL